MNKQRKDFLLKMFTAANYYYIQSIIIQMGVEDLHFSKKWFHGKIAGGLRVAEERVKNFGVEGSCLVRQSESLPGEFALCFLYV